MSARRRPAREGAGGEPAGAGSCPFCAIARGDLSGRVVLEEAHCLAFLDHRPLFPGHCLLIPREHCETLADLPAPLVGPLFMQARRLARAIERAFQAEGSFVAINNRVSQSVPHLHVHVVPRRRGDGLRGFFWPRQRYQDVGAAGDAQQAVREALASLESDEAASARAREPR
jgi:histidine triad (HIT) family protein